MDVPRYKHRTLLRNCIRRLEKGKPNSDNPDDEASKPIDPDDPDDEDLNEDTDQYN